MAGPVGSGKTALIEALVRLMSKDYSIGVITNDIYTKEDAEFLHKNSVLPMERIVGVETGGCPHTAIREDASMNLEAVDELSKKFPDLDIIFIESGGDNLSATFSPELSDATIFVIDVAEGDKIPRKGGPGITRSDLLVINKIDLVKKESLLKLIDLYQKEYNFEAVIPVSSIKSKYRDIILDEIEKVLKPGPAYYDVEEYTDQTMRQLAEETIREKALMYLQDEVPHGIYVEVTKMKLKKTKNKEEFYDIEATIYCLRESHKGIIIGKDGTMLKRIGQSARIDMERNFGTKVNLRTWVKVKENWLDDTSVVKKFKLQ